MDGEYRRRDGDEIVEPLFAALHAEDSESFAAPRRRRTVLVATVLVALAFAAWFVVS